ncbi:MAG TPA: hypothetical protein VNG33_07910 [Polyangiaceae bacterium]|nr:hypothetical protein [Polyangiaceae bacterium]
MSYAAVAQDETEDRYHTQVEAGDVRLFTLDQLDAAFNVGLIHENTYVCLEGGSEWLTLGEVAGLGDEDPVSAPHLVAAPVSHYSTSSSVMPAALYSVAPMVMPRSIAPVVSDFSFDDDFEMMAMRPKRRFGKVLAAFTVLGLAAAGFAFVQSGSLHLPKLNLAPGVERASAASLSLSSLKDAVQATPQPLAAAPAPEATKPEPPKVEEAKPVDAMPPAISDTDKSASDTATKKSDDRLSEDVKAALLSKDKTHAADQKHKQAARASVAAKHKPAASKAAKGAPGFKSGGSAYDPLNAKL